MRFSLAAAALCLALPAGAAPAELIERVLAVVDETPVLLSETLALMRVRGLERAAALEALIDETLMLREAGRLREAAVTPEEEERALAGLRQKLPREDAVDEHALRRLARRQTAILKYVELRFRPQVRVEEAELLSAYRERYGETPGAPTFEALLPELRARLADSALDQRVEEWVAELRALAHIRYNAPGS